MTYSHGVYIKYIFNSQTYGQYQNIFRDLLHHVPLEIPIPLGTFPCIY
jgi:hypothetical protein